MFFEDFEIGQRYTTASRRITEDEIVAFAQQWDKQFFHLDKAAAEASMYGGLIASGWHTASVMMKLLASTLGESSLGSPGGDELRWSAPVRPGDELRLRVTVESKKASATKPDRGTLIYRNEVFNQHGEGVMTFVSTMFLRRRPTALAE